MHIKDAASFRERHRRIYRSSSVAKLKLQFSYEFCKRLLSIVLLYTHTRKSYAILVWFFYFSKKNSIKVNNYLSSLKPFHTDWRIPPLSVSCIKCAVPISSGFNQTTFLYLSNQGLFNVNRF